MCRRKTRNWRDQQTRQSRRSDPLRRSQQSTPSRVSHPGHRMRTQVNKPPIHAASGRAAMIAAISTHSAVIRTSGVNLVMGTSSAASRPAPPNPAKTSAPHSTG